MRSKTIKIYQGAEIRGWKELKLIFQKQSRLLSIYLVKFSNTFYIFTFILRIFTQPTARQIIVADNVLSIDLIRKRKRLVVLRFRKKIFERCTRRETNCWKIELHTCNLSLFINITACKERL